MLQGRKQSVLCSYVFQELPKLYKSVCTKKPKKFLQTKQGGKAVKPDVKCEKCQYKSTLLQMKSVHGPRPARASKRLLNFTPKVAKRSKSDNILMNSEGVFNDSSVFMMENSLLVMKFL